MTDEEAKKILNTVLLFGECDCPKEEIEECLKMAVKALEQEPCEMTAEEYRQRMIQAFHNADCDRLIALCVLPTEKEFEHLEWLLKTHYKKEPCDDAISRQAVLDKLNRLIEVERLQGTDEMGYGRERVSAYENMIFEINSEYLYPSVTPQPKTESEVRDV